MIFKKLSSAFAPDIAIDLGTSNIVVSLKDKGIIINEPAVVAIQTTNKGEKKVVSVGSEAKKMIGKTHKSIEAIRPMKDGVIADFDTTELMINYFIKKAYKKNPFFKPRVIISIPYGVTPVERKAVEEAVLKAGARSVFLIEEPLAAAIGANIPVSDANGHIVVDIGSGTTEIGLISLGALVNCNATRIASDVFDDSIMRYIKYHYNLNIGEGTAEEIKIEIGTAVKQKKKLKMDVKGRDNLGFLKTIQVDSEEIRNAISEPLKQIVNSIKKVLEQMPPDLAADVIDNGVILTGGGSLLKGIDKYISNIIKLPVRRSEEPLFAVSYGTYEVLNNSDLLNLIDNN